MKTIKFLTALAFMFLLCLTAKAQWAGEDKEILRELDNSQTVSIGVNDGSSDKCYEWSGPHIISSDKHQPVIVVRPQDEEETYTCTRTSSCGVEQDQVKVKVIDTISIVSVTPLKNCYNDGDDVHLQDFEIVTYPAGHQSLVVLSPTHVNNNWEWGANIDETQEITFTLEYNNHTSTKTATVNVFNDNLAVSTGQSYNFKAFVKSLKAIENIVKKAKGLSDKLNSIAHKAPGMDPPCEPGFNIFLDIPDDNEQDIHSCCNGEEVDGFKVVGNAVSAELALDCFIPTQLSLPWLGGVRIHVGGSLGASVGPFEFKYLGNDCNTTSVPASVYATLSGGVQILIVSDDVLNAQLDLVGKAQTGFNWVIGQKFEIHPLDLTLTVVGQVIFMNFFYEKVNYPLFSYQLFNE